MTQDTSPRSATATVTRLTDYVRSTPRHGLGAVARVATWIWLAVSAVNAVVWLLVGIIGGTFGAPWFLWAFAAGAAVVGGLHLAAHSYQPRPARTSQPTRTSRPTRAIRASDGEDW